MLDVEGVSVGVRVGRFVRALPCDSGISYYALTFMHTEFIIHC